MTRGQQQLAVFTLKSKLHSALENDLVPSFLL
jgi:hypothetical protein